jgi:hypothetical protein
MSATTELPESALRDTRFARIHHALGIQADLRDNDTIKAIMGAVRFDADAALDELVDLAPTDVNAISAALVRIRTLVYIRRTISNILTQGDHAQRSIMDEDQARQMEEEG